MTTIVLCIFFSEPDYFQVAHITDFVITLYKLYSITSHRPWSKFEVVIIFTSNRLTRHKRITRCNTKQSVFILFKLYCIEQSRWFLDWRKCSPVYGIGLIHARSLRLTIQWYPSNLECTDFRCSMFHYSPVLKSVVSANLNLNGQTFINFDFWGSFWFLNVWSFHNFVRFPRDCSSFRSSHDWHFTWKS